MAYALRRRAKLGGAKNLHDNHAFSFSSSFFESSLKRKMERRSRRRAARSGAPMATKRTFFVSNLIRKKRKRKKKHGCRANFFCNFFHGSVLSIQVPSARALRSPNLECRLLRRPALSPS